MISSLLQIVAGLLIGASVVVLVVSLKDHLLNLCRNIILPALGQMLWLAADALRTLLDMIEKTVTYTALEAKRAIKRFQDTVMGIISRYQTVSETQVEVTTTVYAYQNGVLYETGTGQAQRVATTDVPEYILEKLKQRQNVEMRHEDDLVQLVQH